VVALLAVVGDVVVHVCGVGERDDGFRLDLDIDGSQL
jgi:hypothetical protein